MDFKKDIGRKIYNLRVDNDLTQQDFVDKLNDSCSRANLSKIESGISMPSAEFIQSVCRAFNISSDCLLDINVFGINDEGFKAVVCKFMALSKEEQTVILRLIDILADKR